MVGSAKVQLNPFKAEFANCLLHNLLSASSPIPLSANGTVGRSSEEEEDDSCDGSADERVVRARKRERKRIVGRCMLERARAATSRSEVSL